MIRILRSNISYKLFLFFNILWLKKYKFIDYICKTSNNSNTFLLKVNNGKHMTLSCEKLFLCQYSRLSCINKQYHNNLLTKTMKHDSHLKYIEW
jgi:hypothetical protein